MDSIKNSVTEPLKSLQMVITELDIITDDFLEKGKFALMELMGVTTIHTDDTPNDKTHNLNRAHMLADIAFDYLTQAQSTLVNLTIRETENKGGKTDD